MKIEYLSEVPPNVKRTNTRWCNYLAEFWKTDQPVMKITIDPEKDGKPLYACNAVRRCINNHGYRMHTFYRENIVIIEKLEA